MIHQERLAALANKRSGFVAAQVRNLQLALADLLNFKPQAPTQLCQGSRDPTVPVANMTSAVSYFASQGVTVTAVDVEQVPTLKPVIDMQVAAAGGLSTYHGSIIPPLCASVAKAFFDPRK